MYVFIRMLRKITGEQSLQSLRLGNCRNQGPTKNILLWRLYKWMFRGSMLRWATIEKTASAIVETCKGLEYLLLRMDSIYSPPIEISSSFFDPRSIENTVARYRADKLQRWSIILQMFRYTVNHVPGEENVWGDLLSRWGCSRSEEVTYITRKCCALAVVDIISPLENDAFDWLSLKETGKVQEEELKKHSHYNFIKDEESLLWVDGVRRIWIPDDTINLQKRLCVVAHAGPAGHRGEFDNASDIVTTCGVENIGR